MLISTWVIESDQTRMLQNPWDARTQFKISDIARISSQFRGAEKIPEGAQAILPYGCLNKVFLLYEDIFGVSIAIHA